MKLAAKITATILLVAFCFAESRAQKVRTLSGYAIQIQFKGKPIFYDPIYESDLAANNKLFGFGPGGYTRRSPRDEDFVSLIKLVVSLDGGEWKIKVSVVKGAFRDKGEQDVGTYRAGLNQMITVSEIDRLGVEPFEVAIVTIKPEVAIRPEVLNKTSSLAVLNLLGAVVPAPYQLLLQNLSHKGVAALEVDAYSGGRKTWMIRPLGNSGYPLIDAGATYEVKIKSTSGQSTPGGTYQRQPERIEIVTVVFLDGTYEGDEDFAASVNTRMAESKLQLRRVLALLQDASAAADGPVDIIANLSKAAVELSDYPAPGEFDEVSARFPTLDVRQRDFLRTSATEGLHAVKATLRYDLAQLQATQTTDRTLLKDWLKRMREKYEKWLGSL